MPLFRLSICTLPCILAASVAAAAAQSPAQGSYTLAELAALATRDSRLLGSQDARVEESRLAAAQARSWPGPSLDVQAGRRRQDSLSGPRYELAFSQPLLLLGKPGLRGGLGDVESEAWRVRRVNSEIGIILDVARLAYEYAANRRRADSARTRQRRFELIQEYLKGRVFPTPQRKAESDIVRNRLQGLIGDALQSQAGFKASLDKLKVYVPLAAGEYPDIEVRWFAGTQALDEEEWLARALGHNPGLRLQRLAVRSAELEERLASRDGLPDPALVASYEEGRTAETEKNYGLGLSLALPSWNRNRSGLGSARQRRLAEERQLGFDEQKLRAEVSRALVEYEAARRIVMQYPQAALAELEAQLQDAEAGFRKGQVDLLTFLELDSSAAETFGRVLDAQVDLAARAAELILAAGGPDALAQLGSL